MIESRGALLLKVRVSWFYLVSVIFFLADEGFFAVYSLIAENSIRHILEREFLPFLLALIVAQLYFKWGSFALELVGFVVVWFVFGLVVDRVLRAIRR